MSAAMTVSAFYDVDCFSSQNRRNLAQQQTHSHPAHKPIGTPITNNRHMTPPNRNLLERSVSEPADKNSNSAIMAQQQQQNRQQQNVNSSRYKTELCRPFEENGYCKYGDKCQFAHGMPELRSLARHPKYKTELCRTFHTIGFCPYGPRCHFIHNEDERKLGEIDHMKEERGHGGSMPPSPPISNQGPPSHMGRLSPPHHSATNNQSTRRSYGLSLPLVRDSLGSTADSPTSSVTDSPIMSPTFVGDSDMLSSSFSSAASGPFSHPPPMSAPPRSCTQNAFSFHDLPPMQQQQQAATLMSPLNIHTDTMASLAAEMQAMLSLSQRHNNNHNINVLASLQQHHQQKQSAMGLFGLAGLTSGLVGLPEDNLYGAPPSPPDSLSGDSSSSCSSSMSTSSMCGSPLEVSRGLRLPIFTALSHE